MTLLFWIILYVLYNHLAHLFLPQIGWNTNPQPKQSSAPSIPVVKRMANVTSAEIVVTELKHETEVGMSQPNYYKYIRIWGHLVISLYVYILAWLIHERFVYLSFPLLNGWQPCEVEKEGYRPTCALTRILNWLLVTFTTPWAVATKILSLPNANPRISENETIFLSRQPFPRQWRQRNKVWRQTGPRFVITICLSLRNCEF